MKEIFESVAARAANGWQRAGTKFDFEVLAMPGGSVMAPALWAYSMVVSALKRPSQHSASAQSAAEGTGTQRSPSGESSGESSGEAQDSAPGLHCDWSGCHCT
jgi:hypothetical protein